ncbi:MAG: thermitase, partial [Pseudonocardiales bacterium]|nr:thermitase [Pseudonocardiales bacterium]
MRLRRTAAVAALGTAALAASLLAASARASAPAQRSASAHGTAPATHAADRVLVKFTPKATNASITAALHAVGASEIGQIADIDVHVLRVPSGAVDRVVAALSRRHDVGFAEPDGIVQALDVVPNDPYWANQWGPKKISSGATWSTTTGNSAVVISVLDTGLNSALAEFAGRVLPGYNFIGNNTTVSDDNGHGTEVTGVALAQGNNATGVAGMCWTCS